MTAEAGPVEASVAQPLEGEVRLNTEDLRKFQETIQPLLDAVAPVKRRQVEQALLTTVVSPNGLKGDELPNLVQDLVHIGSNRRVIHPRTNRVLERQHIHMLSAQARYLGIGPLDTLFPGTQPVRVYNELFDRIEQLKAHSGSVDHLTGGEGQRENAVIHEMLANIWEAKGPDWFRALSDEHLQNLVELARSAQQINAQLEMGVRHQRVLGGAGTLGGFLSVLVLDPDLVHGQPDEQTGLTRWTLSPAADKAEDDYDRKIGTAVALALAQNPRLTLPPIGEDEPEQQANLRVAEARRDAFIELYRDEVNQTIGALREIPPVLKDIRARYEKGGVTFLPVNVVSAIYDQMHQNSWVPLTHALREQGVAGAVILPKEDGGYKLQLWGKNAEPVALDEASGISAKLAEAVRGFALPEVRSLIEEKAIHLTDERQLGALLTVVHDSESALPLGGVDHRIKVRSGEAEREVIFRVVGPEADVQLLVDGKLVSYDQAKETMPFLPREGDMLMRIALTTRDRHEETKKNQPVPAEEEGRVAGVLKTIGRALLNRHVVREGMIYQASRPSVEDPNLFYALSGKELLAIDMAEENPAWKPALEVLDGKRVVLEIGTGDAKKVKTAKVLTVDAKNASAAQLADALGLNTVDMQQAGERRKKIGETFGSGKAETIAAKYNEQKDNVIDAAREWAKQNIGMAVGGTVAALCSVIFRNVQGAATGAGVGALLAGIINKLTGVAERGDSLLARYNPEKMVELDGAQAAARG